MNDDELGVVRFLWFLRDLICMLGWHRFGAWVRYGRKQRYWRWCSRCGIGQYQAQSPGAPVVRSIRRPRDLADYISRP